MKIKLLEIEFGSANPAASRVFYKSILGLESALDIENLTVFTTGASGIDFNISNHIPPQKMVTSFLTDELETVMKNLRSGGVEFRGPEPSHLGMRMIEFSDPDGFTVRVNEATDESPAWLRIEQ